MGENECLNRNDARIEELGQVVAVSQHGEEANVRQREGDGTSEAGGGQVLSKGTGAQTPNRGGCRCVQYMYAQSVCTVCTLYGIKVVSCGRGTLRLKGHTPKFRDFHL